MNRSSSFHDAASTTTPLVSNSVLQPAARRSPLEDDAATALVGLYSSSPRVVTANSASALMRPLDEEPSCSPMTKTQKMDKNTYFPVVLMSILSDPANSHVISWTPDGQSFVVLKPYKLAESVLPRYFKGRVGKYCSFSRKLHRYGFKRPPAASAAAAARNGEDVFMHELFLRDAPELCRKIRVASRPSTDKQTAKKSHPSSSLSALIQALPSKSMPPSTASTDINTAVPFAFAAQRLSTHSASQLLKQHHVATELARVPLGQPAASLEHLLRIRIESQRDAYRRFFLSRRVKSRASIERLQRLHPVERMELANNYNYQGEEVRDVLRRALEVVRGGVTVEPQQLSQQAGVLKFLFANSAE